MVFACKEAKQIFNSEEKVYLVFNWFYVYSIIRFNSAAIYMD